MSVNRSKLIDELVDNVENWDFDALINYAQIEYKSKLISLSNKELEEEYVFFFDTSED